MKTTIADRLRIARTNKGLTKKQVSKLVPYSYTSVKKHEHHTEYTTDIRALEIYANLYGVCKIWLAYGVRVKPQLINKLYDAVPESIQSAIIHFLQEYIRK